MSSRFTVEDAVRRGNKARVALAGPAGSGKTFTALTIATELAKGGDILVLDTERGSASLYADLFTFKTIRWEPPYDPRELAQEVIANCTGFEVIVIDSLSHFWKGEGGTLAIVDQVAAQQRGPDNKFAAWNTGTKAQDQMVSALLTSPCHVIATMRSKMAYVQEKVTDDKGREKTQIRRLGMEPVQRDDLEYEFTVTADLDKEHNLRIEKTRCSVLADAVFEAGQASQMGRTLKEWLDGAAPELVGGELDWFEANEWRDQAEHDEWRKSRLAALAHEKTDNPDAVPVIDKWCAEHDLTWKVAVAKPLAVAFDAFMVALAQQTPEVPHAPAEPPQPANQTHDVADAGQICAGCEQVVTPEGTCGCPF